MPGARVGRERRLRRQWTEREEALKQSVKDAHDLQHALRYHAHVHLEEDG